MKNIVGIKFRQEGKVYDFDSRPYILDRGCHVMVETERGLCFGTVCTPTHDVEEGDKTRNDLKKIFRPATEEDIDRHRKNLDQERKGYLSCLKLVKEFNVEMNLVDVEMHFDGNKMVFYFTAEGRIDFRDLVKRLVKELGTRVEMRQIGVRHKAKICGGMGRCGREVCCVSLFDQFFTVSVKMAKIQGLSLNPTKISGSCGRLMCCLSFEYDIYRRLIKDLPSCGSLVETTRGRGRVIQQEIFKNCVIVQFEDGTTASLSTKEIKGIVLPEPAKGRKRSKDHNEENNAKCKKETRNESILEGDKS
ncbi:MAG: regulatory iron-sulfur-containing complex subunit RicT [Pseudomonadota bacterium]